MVYEARQPVRLNYILAILCASLSILGLLVAGVIPTESTTNHGAYPLTGWGIFAACLGVAAIFVQRARDNRVLVRANAYGLYSKLYSDATIPWDAIEGIQLLRIKSQSILRVKLRDKQAWPSRAGVVRLFGALDNALGFGDFGINPTFYDRGIQALVDTMLHYRPDLAR